MNLKATSSPEVEPDSQTLVIRNRLDDLTELNKWSREMADKLGIPAQGGFQLDLVLSETVTNIIEHAYEDKNDHTIAITLYYQQNKIIAQVNDDGKPFNPREAPEVLLPDKLEDATEGGLGIHLIRNFTDELYYQRQDDKNIFTIIIYDPKETTQ